jgi:hypothetical protein
MLEIKLLVLFDLTFICRTRESPQQRGDSIIKYCSLKCVTEYTFYSYMENSELAFYDYQFSVWQTDIILI